MGVNWLNFLQQYNSMSQKLSYHGGVLLWENRTLDLEALFIILEQFDDKHYMLGAPEISEIDSVQSQLY